MNILCETKEELKKVLEKLDKDGLRWISGEPCVEWGMEELDNFPTVICTAKYITWDFDVDDYEDRVTAAQFLADAELNTEKEGEPRPEILIDKAEYNKAVIETIKELGEDKQLEGVSRLVVQLVGAMFATKVKDRLFKEEKENGSK